MKEVVPMDNRVEMLRKAKGLRQEDFAKRIGVTRQTVSSIENGRYNPSLELAFVIAEVLEKSIEEIFLWKSKQETEKNES